jgi:predicted metal-dependent hydrolase
MVKPKNIVRYHEIGDVRYVQNRRARNLSIRINQQGDVQVTIPRNLSQKRAEAFLMSRKGWILSKLSDLDRWLDLRDIVKEGEVIRVRGKEVPVILKAGEQSMEDTIWRILLDEARTFLPKRVHELASLHDFQVNTVRVRKMTSRWGSCSASNTINLNSWLMMIPDYLSDYVILHELTHTIHRNHSAEFWNALDRVTGGDSKKLRKELHNHRIMSINTEDQFSG